MDGNKKERRIMLGLVKIKLFISQLLFGATVQTQKEGKQQVNDWFSDDEDAVQEMGDDWLVGGVAAKKVVTTASVVAVGVSVGYIVNAWSKSGKSDDDTLSDTSPYGNDELITRARLLNEGVMDVFDGKKSLLRDTESEKDALEKEYMIMHQQVLDERDLERKNRELLLKLERNADEQLTWSQMNEAQREKWASEEERDQALLIKGLSERVALEDELLGRGEWLQMGDKKGSIERAKKLADDVYLYLTRDLSKSSKEDIDIYLQSWEAQEAIKAAKWLRTQNDVDTELWEWLLEHDKLEIDVPVSVLGVIDEEKEIEDDDGGVKVVDKEKEVKTAREILASLPLGDAMRLKKLSVELQDPKHAKKKASFVESVKKEEYERKKRLIYDQWCLSFFKKLFLKNGMIRKDTLRQIDEALKEASIEIDELKKERVGEQEIVDYYESQWFGWSAIGYTEEQYFTARQKCRFIDQEILRKENFIWMADLNEKKVKRWVEGVERMGITDKLPDELIALSDKIYDPKQIERSVLKFKDVVNEFAREKELIGRTEVLWSKDEEESGEGGEDNVFDLIKKERKEREGRKTKRVSLLDGEEKESEVKVTKVGKIGEVIVQKAYVPEDAFSDSSSDGDEEDYLFARLEEIKNKIVKERGSEYRGCILIDEKGIERVLLIMKGLEISDVSYIETVEKWAYGKRANNIDALKEELEDAVLAEKVTEERVNSYVRDVFDLLKLAKIQKRLSDSYEVEEFIVREIVKEVIKYKVLPVAIAEKIIKAEESVDRWYKKWIKEVRASYYEAKKKPHAPIALGISESKSADE